MYSDRSPWQAVMRGKLTHREWLEEDRLLDEALKDTFPASDPVAMQQTVIVGRMPRPDPSLTRKQDSAGDPTRAQHPHAVRRH